jgi:hypothetical protein
MDRCILTLSIDGNRDAHQQMYGDDQHEAKFSHELIGGAAAFEAMKAFENSQRRKGMPREYQSIVEYISIQILKMRAR